MRPIYDVDFLCEADFKREPVISQDLIDVADQRKVDLHAS
jgi:hypothetical protein